MQHVSGGFGPSRSHIANVLRLCCREVRNPLYVTAPGSALERAGDRLQRLFVSRERGLARFLTRLDDPLVQLADTLGCCFETSIG
jgi:hypothetical protein